MHLTMQAKKNQRCCYCLLLRRLSKISPHTLWTRSASLKLFVIHKLFAYCTLFTTKDLQNSHLATYTVNHIGVTKAVCLSHAFYHKWSSKSTPCHIHCEPQWNYKMFAHHTCHHGITKCLSHVLSHRSGKSYLGGLAFGEAGAAEGETGEPASLSWQRPVWEIQSIDWTRFIDSTQFIN